MRKAWLGVLTLGVVAWLVPACSGAEFSGAGDDVGGSAGSDAAGGVPTEPTGGALGNGGAADSGASTGGSSAGSSSLAGQGGAVTGEAGADGGGAGPGPIECPLDMFPPDVAGDCQRSVCVDGAVTSEIDSKDLPTPRGICDVPGCAADGSPKLHADDSKCAANMRCVTGNCACRACPNGKIANTVADSCILPEGVTAVADKTLQNSSALHAFDGTTGTTWNSGTTDGKLTLTLPTPQAMTALVVYVTGSAEGMVTRTISVTATVDLSDMTTPVTKSGTWDFSSVATGPIRLELGLVKASKITLKFSSPSSWIAVNEVLFVVCS